MAETKTYYFADYTVAIDGPGGAFPIRGAAKEGITIDYSEDRASMTLGADGEWMHSLHAAKGGTATITLLRTNTTNALLSDMFKYETQGSANYGQNVITIRNAQNGDSITCNGCGIARAPANTLSEDGGTLQWRFNCGAIDMLFGRGSPSRF